MNVEGIMELENHHLTALVVEKKYLSDFLLQRI
jgi:hypothetical protein